jgi:hypothetical protein
VFSCGSEDETTPKALAEQAETITAEFLAEIDDEAKEERSKLRRFRQRVYPSILLVSLAVAFAPFVAHTPAPTLAFEIPAGLLATPSLLLLALLPLRLRNMIFTINQEKDDIAKTVTEAGAELSRFFLQERRSRVAGHELRGYLRGLRSADVYRATRRISSPLLPGSRDFPDWTPLPPDQMPQIPDFTEPELTTPVDEPTLP